MAQGQPTSESTPKPKIQVPWLWLAPAILVTTCLMCPCGFGSGWWFGSRGPSSSSIPLIGGGSPLGKYVCDTPGARFLFLSDKKLHGDWTGSTLDFSKDGSVDWSFGKGETVGGSWKQDGKEVTVSIEAGGAKHVAKGTLESNRLRFDGGSVWIKK